MKHHKIAQTKFICLGIILIVQLTKIDAKPKGSTQIDELRSRYVTLEKALWEYLDNRQTTDRNRQLNKIFDKSRRFIDDNTSLKFNFHQEKYFSLNRYYEWSLLEKDLIEINGFFSYFKSFLSQYTNSYGGDGSNTVEYNERVNLDFTDSILKDKKFDIKNIMQLIENIMLKQTLYYRAMVDARDQICITKQSPQQFLYSLYSDIALTELKGYTMMQFSWMLLRIYDKGNFTHEANLMREDFEKRAYKTQHLLREIMKRADRTVWTCDPVSHIKGQTYDEITRLLQGYIENEVDMNTEETCRENCAYYQIAKNNGCYKDLYCSRQPRCTGKLLNCQYLDSDMSICPSSLNSTRRYEFIEYESGRILGQKSHCARGSTKVDSWWRWLFWHCSYCFCMCDEQGPRSDRYFNLKETLANTASNKVVTGLRFVKHKRVFHIQIQEGELLPQGNIKLETLQWKPVDSYNIFDNNVKSGIDYHTLAWDKRAIDLDDLTADDPTHIVIGIRMRTVGAHLNLEVKLCEYDYEKGKLINPATNSFWKSNDNTDLSPERRTQIFLRNPDIIRENSVKSLPDSKHNQYIEFTNSDMDKDAAQSTVPFVDIQDVVSNPPVPLSGIGIYHKGRHQSGGFIAPKLITYDFTPHIQTPSKE